QQQQQQQQQYQQQYQQQIQYEQTQQNDQREQERRGLEQQRIKQAQLEEELALARQIEEQMARLQTLKDQRQASEVGSPVSTERSSQGPQIAVSYPAPPFKGEDESYVLPPSTATMPGEARNSQIVHSHMNPQYTQPVEGDEYVDEHTGPRNPQLR
ncbi:hypothetical protein BG006_001988, partial [Podila minutissima]